MFTILFLWLLPVMVRRREPRAPTPAHAHEPLGWPDDRAATRSRLASRRCRWLSCRRAVVTRGVLPGPPATAFWTNPGTGRRRRPARPRLPRRPPVGRRPPAPG